VQDEIAQLLGEPYIDYAVDSAVAGYGRLANERAAVLRGRLETLVAR
jgi:hypothetical protein